MTTPEDRLIAARAAEAIAVEMKARGVRRFGDLVDFWTANPDALDAFQETVVTGDPTDEERDQAKP